MLPSRRGRLLLQGAAPNATLPNLFNLPVCSIHGSHNTSVLKGLPRLNVGMLNFGPQDIEVKNFHPMSSKYMEPIIMLAMPGVFLWAIFMTSFCCFCYRRYRLGLCGEPFPTVRFYPPREVCGTMTVTVVSAGLVGLASFLACLVAFTSYHVAFAGVISAGYRLEAILNASLTEGSTVLSTGLAFSSSLESFGAQITSGADVLSFASDLECSQALLANLPRGDVMLRIATALGSATSLFPPSEVTDALFADLRRPLERYPALVPPLQQSLASLRDRVASLPSLPPLISRLERLNYSVVNTTGVPVRIVDALVSVNETLDAGLPDLTLLASRLSRVSHEQTSDDSYICSNIPPGWSPGDETECDRLQAQLRQVRAALEATDAELPLALFQSYVSLADDFPNLTATYDALIVERRELAAAPNLTALRLDYATLDGTIQQWNPDIIATAIGDVASAAESLSVSNASGLVPQLITLRTALSPLKCVRGVLDSLSRINQTLLQLTPSTKTLVARATPLSASLEAIPSPTAFIAALNALTSALGALPDLGIYTAGVSTLSRALGRVNNASALIAAISSLEMTLELPPTHGELINVSIALDRVMASVPPLAPFRTSLEGLNSTRAALPPLIERALIAIERYDSTGTTTELVSILDATRAAVNSLASTIGARPEEGRLRKTLTSVDAELARMPDTAPTAQQLRGLSGSLATLPPLDGYLAPLAGLMEATATAPSVDSLSSTWTDLNASLLEVPPFSVTEAPLSLYAAEQQLLPSPPTALLNGAVELQRWLADVPQSVSLGKASLADMYEARQYSLSLMRRAFFGSSLRGYTSFLDQLRTVVEGGWWTFLTATFATPAGISAVAVLSCATRTGRPALHVGHVLLALLPWYVLLGASIEMPTALMLQDACEQVPFITRTLTGFLASSEGVGGHIGDSFSSSAFAEAGDAMYSWVVGCPRDDGGDPMSAYFSPIVHVASEAQSNATRALNALDLRPAVRLSLGQLAAESAALASAADAVHTSMNCAKIHKLYLEMHTAVCCDLGYAFTAMWMPRLVTAFGLLASAVAAIAGYKRFRRQRDLWGPYATVQALEVGAYL